MTQGRAADGVGQGAGLRRAPGSGSGGGAEPDRTPTTAAAERSGGWAGPVGRADARAALSYSDEEIRPAVRPRPADGRETPSLPGQAGQAAGGDTPAPAEPVPQSAPRRVVGNSAAAPGAALPMRGLSLDNLHAALGGRVVLRGAKLDVPAGYVTLLLGRADAGKSALLRAVMGELALSSGRISHLGVDMTRWPSVRRVRSGLGYLAQSAPVFGDLSVAENLALACPKGRLEPTVRDTALRLFPALGGVWRRRASALPAASRKMLAVAQVLAPERGVLLLDDLALGLPEAVLPDVVAEVRGRADEGSAVLLVERAQPVARALCDRCAVMEAGRVVWSGSMATALGDGIAAEMADG